MSIRNLDNNHDWTFGLSKNNYLTEQKEIELNLLTRLYCFYNDCFFDADFGIDYWNLLDYRGQAELENQVKEMIVQTGGIVAVDSIDILVDAWRNLTLSYNAYTIYSQNVIGGLPLNSLL